MAYVFKRQYLLKYSLLLLLELNNMYMLYMYLFICFCFRVPIDYIN